MAWGSCPVRDTVGLERGTGRPGTARSFFVSGSDLSKNTKNNLKKKKRGIMQRRTPRAASSVRAADRLSDASICPGDAARGERKLLDASLFLTVYLQLRETSRNKPATSERRPPPCPPPVRRPAPPRAPPTAARVGVEVPGRGLSGRRAFPAVPLGLGVAAARAAGRARVAGGLAVARAAGPTRWPLPEQRRPLVAGTRVPR